MIAVVCLMLVFNFIMIILDSCHNIRVILRKYCAILGRQWGKFQAWLDEKCPKKKPPRTWHLKETNKTELALQSIDYEDFAMKDDRLEDLYVNNNLDHLNVPPSLALDVNYSRFCKYLRSLGDIYWTQRPVRVEFPNPLAMNSENKSYFDAKELKFVETYAISETDLPNIKAMKANKLLDYVTGRLEAVSKARKAIQEISTLSNFVSDVGIVEQQRLHADALRELTKDVKRVKFN